MITMISWCSKYWWPGCHFNSELQATETCKWLQWTLVHSSVHRRMLAKTTLQEQVTNIYGPHSGSNCAELQCWRITQHKVQFMKLPCLKEFSNAIFRWLLLSFEILCHPVKLHLHVLSRGYTSYAPFFNWDSCTSKA